VILLHGFAIAVGAITACVSGVSNKLLASQTIMFIQEQPNSTGSVVIQVPAIFIVLKRGHPHVTYTVIELLIFLIQMLESVELCISL
jgi:hypothetical protein